MHASTEASKPTKPSEPEIGPGSGCHASHLLMTRSSDSLGTVLPVFRLWVPTQSLWTEPSPHLSEPRLLAGKLPAYRAHSILLGTHRGWKKRCLHRSLRRLCATLFFRPARSSRAFAASRRRSTFGERVIPGTRTRR